MSTYLRQTKHPETDEWQVATWMDDFYGSHHYGVKFPNGDVFDPEKIKLETRDGEPMTYTEKRCEKNCPDFNGMSILHIEQCDCSCHPVLAKGELSSIHQAIAEERERVVGIKHKLWTAKSYYSTVGGDERNIGRNLMADDLLSYLTPPIK